MTIHQHCQPSEEQFRAYLRRTDEIVLEHGHMVQAVMGDAENPSFAYTVGLCALQLPELYTIGLPAEIAHFVLNRATRMLRNGQITPMSPISELVEDFDLIPVVMGNLDDLGQARNFHERHSIAYPLRAWQLVYPDKDGVLPWQEGYSLDPRIQPVR